MTRNEFIKRLIKLLLVDLVVIYFMVIFINSFINWELPMFDISMWTDHERFSYLIGILITAYLHIKRIK